MLYIGLFIIVLSLLIVFKFVDINIISEKDAEAVKQKKRRLVAFFVFVLGIVLMLLDIIFE